jgi:hypothetical protein
VGGAAPGGDHRTLLRHLDGPREEEKSHRISRLQSVPAGWPEMCQQEQRTMKNRKIINGE